MCMTPDEMTISQLNQLENVYREGGNFDYANQIAELRDKRIADGWDETFIPKVTPRWTQDLQAVRGGYYTHGYSALERAKSETPGQTADKQSWAESQERDEAATAHAREIAAKQKKADEAAEQAEKFQRHLAHVHV